MEFLAWPGAMFGLGVVFLLLFHAPIGERIKHLRSISKTGVALDPAQQNKPIVQQAEADIAEEKESLLKTFDSPALLAHENAIFSDLQRRRLDYRSDTTKVLVRHYAKTRLLWMCEFVYRLIFGSQIRFLKLLNTSSTGVSFQEARSYYAEATAPNRDLFADDGSEAYFAFLVNQDLIARNDARFFITAFGREFLSWIVQTGVSENRGL